jgi:hypothetical protein
MNEILCFDANGNSIDKLSQWDTNMELFINWEYSVTPIFHFCNTNSKRILVVKGTVDSEDGTIAKANIPNILLQEASPLMVYVYMEKDTPTGYLTGETIYSFQIPVREKPKPVDYKYFENTEYISWVQLKQDMEKQISNLVTHGEEVVGEYETALAQIEAIRDEVSADADVVANSVSENEKILAETKLASENAENAKTIAVSNATTATQQAEIASTKAGEAREDAVEIASNVVIVQNYVEQAKKYAEQSREASDILYLEERVSELESSLGLEVAKLEEVRAYLGI